MAQLDQMVQCQRRGPAMIQDNIGYAIDPAMAGNSHGRERRLAVQGSIDRDKTLDPALLQHILVRCQQFLVVPMGHREKEEIPLAKISFDSANHQGTVSVADFHSDHSDCMAAFHLQRTREKIRLVVQFARRGQNAVFCFLRDRTRRRRINQHMRNGAGTKVDGLRHGLQRRGWLLGPSYFFCKRFHLGNILAGPMPDLKVGRFASLSGPGLYRRAAKRNQENPPITNSSSEYRYFLLTKIRHWTISPQSRGSVKVLAQTQ